MKNSTYILGTVLILSSLPIFFISVRESLTQNTRGVLMVLGFVSLAVAMLGIFFPQSRTALFFIATILSLNILILLAFGAVALVARLTSEKNNPNPPVVTVDVKDTQPTKQQEYDVVLHKIAGLGDEVHDSRSYEEACQPKVQILNTRYTGIINFQLLSSDRAENEGAKAFRRSAYMGGQYSCRFGGKFLSNAKVEPKAVGSQTFTMSHLVGLKFQYPVLEGYEIKTEYDEEKKAGLVMYVGKDKTKPAPTIVVQVFDSPVGSFKEDLRPKENILIWDDHGIGHEYSLNSPIENLDSTIEFRVSDKEYYDISTANFLLNGIPEEKILRVIIDSVSSR